MKVDWIESYFLNHPQQVDETYWQHLRVALSFAGRLFLAATACLIHALIPGLCTKTGSGMINELHDEMVVNRKRHAVNPRHTTSEAVPETAR